MEASQTDSTLPFWDNEAKMLLIEGLMNWPFLGFVLILVILLCFGKGIKERIGSIEQLSFGGKTQIKLGTKVVDANEIGMALTDSFRKLEERVETLEVKPSETETTEIGLLQTTSTTIPEGLQEFIWKAVYPMLNSDYWYARYIDTLAKKVAVRPELMREFLTSRTDVEVFRDEKGWLASLKGKSPTAPKGFSTHPRPPA